MAVVVVGDIDIEQTEKKIIQQFESIPELQNPRPAN
jgi:predicted Zn-dependent peptidase